MAYGPVVGTFFSGDNSFRDMPSNWKQFERLVAAIHQVADGGADVRWNESINGRQFDVTIRFRQGLYDYLTVIECKDYEKPVPVEKVEAFVTKSHDVHAHHAVMASTSGFQEGAREVAQRHSITLIHVTDSEEVDLSPFAARWAGTAELPHIDGVQLEYVDGEKKSLSQESHAMTYYVRHILTECGPQRLSLADIIECHTPRFVGGPLEVYKDHVITCRPGTRVVAPDDGEFPLRPLARIHVRAGMTRARLVTSPAPFEMHLLLPDVKVTTIASGEEATFHRHGLPLGIDTSFAEGTFYEDPNLAAFYYCDRLDGGLAFMYLVESFQAGSLIQAHFSCPTENSKYYVPVKDNAILQRLQRRLDNLKQAKK
jgi:hypothetical protein